MFLDKDIISEIGDAIAAAFASLQEKISREYPCRNAASVLFCYNYRFSSFCNFTIGLA